MAATDQATEGQLDIIVSETQAAFDATKVIRGLLTNLSTTFKTNIVGAINEVDGKITGANIKTLYEGNAETNAYTDAEKAKLAGLDDNHFKGTHLNLAALNTAHATAAAGDYADVDAGVGTDIERYIWDTNDSKWVVQSGAVGGETAASILTKYESNADRNGYTDAEKAKLAAIVVSTKDYTGSITA